MPIATNSMPVALALFKGEYFTQTNLMMAAIRHAEGSLLDLRPYLEKDGIKPDDYFPVAVNFPKQQDGAHAA